MVTATPPAQKQHTARPWAFTAMSGGGAALVSALITVTAGPTAATIMAWVMIATVAVFGGWLAFYDFREHCLPNVLVYPLYGATIVLVAASALTAGNLLQLGSALITGSLLWILNFLFGMVGGVAFGDVKLAGVLGLFLGWWGVVPAVIGAVTAYVLALPHAAIHVLSKQDTRKIPFGPYMVAGALVVAIWQITSR